jgi:hypothetical protein
LSATRLTNPAGITGSTPESATALSPAQRAAIRAILTSRSARSRRSDSICSSGRRRRSRTMMLRSSTVPGCRPIAASTTGAHTENRRVHDCPRRCGSLHRHGDGRHRARSAGLRISPTRRRLVERVREVVPGFSDRIVPVSPRGATILKQRALPISATSGRPGSTMPIANSTPRSLPPMAGPPASARRMLWRACSTSTASARPPGASRGPVEDQRQRGAGGPNR